MDSEFNELPKAKRRNYVKKVEHEWSHEEIMKLIAAIKERQLLWDITAPEYKLPKANAWREVVDAIDGTISVDDAKGKWTNLRISFKNNLAKYHSKTSEQGPDDEKVIIHWRYFKSLMFLAANDKDNEIEISVASSPIIASSETETPTPSGIVVGKRKRFQSSHRFKVENSPKPISLMSTPKPTTTPTSTPIPTLNPTPSAQESITVLEDRFSAFGNYVSSELRSLPLEQAIFVQRELNRELLRLLDDVESSVWT